MARPCRRAPAALDAARLRGQQRASARKAGPAAYGPLDPGATRAAEPVPVPRSGNRAPPRRRWVRASDTGRRPATASATGTSRTIPARPPPAGASSGRGRSECPRLPRSSTMSVPATGSRMTASGRGRSRGRPARSPAAIAPPGPAARASRAARGAGTSARRPSREQLPEPGREQIERPARGCAPRSAESSGELTRRRSALMIASAPRRPSRAAPARAARDRAGRIAPRPKGSRYAATGANPSGEEK